MPRNARSKARGGLAVLHSGIFPGNTTESDFEEPTFSLKALQIVSLEYKEE